MKKCHQYFEKEDPHDTIFCNDQMYHGEIA